MNRALLYAFVGLMAGVTLAIAAYGATFIHRNVGADFLVLYESAVHVAAAAAMLLVPGSIALLSSIRPSRLANAPIFPAWVDRWCFRLLLLGVFVTLASLLAFRHVNVRVTPDGPEAWMGTEWQKVDQKLFEAVSRHNARRSIPMIWTGLAFAANGIARKFKSLRRYG